jgi:DNA-binding beta-propeller fold protein YncE
MNALRAIGFTTSSRSRLQPVADWPRLPAEITLDRVVGVGVDSRGFVYVAHRGEQPLLCLNPDGSLYREVGAGVQQKSTAYDRRGPVPVPIATRCWMHGLHVDPWDNVWITDVGRHLVMKFSPGGELVLTLGVDGEPGCDSRHFDQPTHICVVPSGEIFVTDGYGNSRIVKFSADGDYCLEWGRRGTAPGEFHTPHVITPAGDGLLYVTDRENDRIQVFDQMGRVHAAWPDLHSVDGLFAAADGFLYGSAGIDHALLRLDLTGRVLDVWAEPGMFCYPHAVCVDPSGALYTADTGDTWTVTGRRPEERSMATRNSPEGSAVRKLTIQPPA